MKGYIFSPGKLLITSEYVVLDGALALAVPTQLGQEFFFEEIDDQNSFIFWEAHYQNKPWLKIKIDYSKWTILETNLQEPAKFILKILKNIQLQSIKKFQKNTTYYLKTNLQFPPDYGLGSSSTLMNNLSEWAQIDAFALNETNLGGSGYDIAVAQQKSTILFRNLKGEITSEKVDYHPSFKQELIFVHLNQKQDSRAGITHYRSKEKSTVLIDYFTELTQQVVHAKNLEEFSNLMEIHENKLSNFLELPTIKKEKFKDCPTFIKSLGAWGGDFIMSAKFDGYQDYFTRRGFPNFYEWNKLLH